jgi:hypothetical protein
MMGLQGRKAALRSNVYDFVEEPATLTECCLSSRKKARLQRLRDTENDIGNAIEVDVTARDRRTIRVRPLL